jgi:hypothetical protein
MAIPGDNSLAAFSRFGRHCSLQFTIHFLDKKSNRKSRNDEKQWSTISR